MMGKINGLLFLPEFEHVPEVIKQRLRDKYGEDILFKHPVITIDMDTIPSNAINGRVIWTDGNYTQTGWINTSDGTTTTINYDNTTDINTNDNRVESGTNSGINLPF